MRITIHLVGALHEYVPGSKEWMSINVDDASTVRQALTAVHIPVELVKAILVDGERSSLNERLADGQQITVMALIGGGSAV